MEKPMLTLEDLLTPDQRRIWESLNSPMDIQAYLDDTPYSIDSFDRSPLRVMQDGVAHCLDGGLFAAAALRYLGYPPLLIDIFPIPNSDDDHILAIFKHNGAYGCLAKSNFPGLRSRQPVYRSLRELVMSYFEVFFSMDGTRSLRTYTAPLDLSRFDRYEWTVRDEAGPIIEASLARMHKYPVLTPAMEADLPLMDAFSYKVFTTGVNPAGLFKPKK
jgi:hypothetical protein